MKKALIFFSIVIFFSFCFVTTKSQKIEVTDTGIEYKFIEKNKKNRKVETDDILYLSMKFFHKDSLLYNTADFNDDFKFQLTEPVYEGDFVEILQKMNEGDSVIIFTDATEFYQNYDNHVPDFVSEGDKIEFRFRLTKVLSQEEETEIMENMNKDLKIEEEKALKKYIEAENITVQPTESGLYYIQTQAGTGEQAVAGKTVVVHYTGYLLNGDIFDSSVERGTPFEFTLGENRVIAGWEEGIAMMKIGEKAKLIIPSHLGYGARGAGGAIPPYATIIFDVELLELK